MTDKEFGQFLALLDKAIEVLELVNKILPVLAQNPDLAKLIVDAIKKN